MDKNTYFTFGGLVLGGLLASSANAQFGTQAAELDLIKVQDDLYVIHNELVPGNTVALITDDGVLLVDDKFEIDHDNLMAILKTVTDQPVKYVINTHYHGDHSGGNAKLQALDAIAVASDQARMRMVAANQPGLPDVTVRDTASLYVGGKPVQLYWLGRSHTDGDVVVLFPEHGVLAAGDMYTVGEGLPQLIDYAGGGSAKEWTATVDKVLQLNFDTVVPGHGTVVTKADMQQFRDSTVRLRELVGELVSQNKPKAEVEAAMRVDFGWQDFHVQMSLDGLINEMR
jgi:glyoxylase-like metal-dependent hydrolase (beta-lactamase superfamily II)